MTAQTDAAGSSQPQPAGAVAGGVRPYGPIGLVVSTTLILLATTLLCALVACAAFGIAALALGWREALDRFVDLDPSGGDAAFVEREGVVVSLAIYAAFSACLLAAARLRGGAAHWRALVAWRAWTRLADARFVAILLVVTLAYSLAANIAVEWVHPAAKDWVRLPEGAVPTTLFVALAVVAAPITEELLFRGWLYTGLRVRLRAGLTILVTATLFGLAHWERTHLYALAVFPVGLALGVVRERTGTIAATMGFHAAYNGFACLLLVFGR